MTRPDTSSSPPLQGREDPQLARLLRLPLIGPFLQGQVWLVGLGLRAYRRWSSINGYERAATIAAKGFLTVVPLIIVVNGLVTRAGREGAADAIIDRLRLNGAGAAAVRELFTVPAGVPTSFTIPGLVLLLYSGMGFLRSLQRLWEAAWEQRPQGIRSTGWVATAVMVLLIDLILLNLIGTVLRGVPADWLLALLTRAAVGVVFWVALQWLLLARRVPVRRLLPGGVMIAGGLAILSLASAVWVPTSINHYASRYGLIGVKFVCVSWLVTVSLVLVAGAVLSAELARGEGPRWTRGRDGEHRSVPSTG